MGNKMAALGGIAAGLGGVLQKKADQKYEEEKKHRDLVNNLVVGGITSGQISDPDAALQFLMSGGKGIGKGKELDPGIQTLVDGVKNHPALQEGQQMNPLSGAGATTIGPTTQGPAGATQAGPAYDPALPPRTQNTNPLHFLSADEMDARAVNRAGATREATVFGEYGTKVRLAQRMVQDGVAKNIEEALTRVGLRDPKPLTGTRPFSITDHIPSTAVPEGALTVSGAPFDKATTAWAKTVGIHTGWNPDGTPSWETRYEPGSAPTGGAGGAETAATRSVREALRLAHGPGTPDPWTPERIEREVGNAREAMIKAQGQNATYGATQKGEALGVLPSVYDALPSVQTLPDGTADPVSKAAFETALNKLPKGPSLLNLVQQAADYKMPTTAFTSRQIGGLNRAEFISLVSRYDPSFDDASYANRQKTKDEWLAGGKAGASIISGKTLIGHLNELYKAGIVLGKYQSDTLGGGWTNQLETGIARTTGGKDRNTVQGALETFNTKRQAVADELKRLFTVSGSGSQAEIDAWLALADPYKTKTEKKAFIQAAGSLMKDRIRPLIKNYQEVMGKPPRPGQSLDKEDVARLQAMGIDTNDLAAQAPGTGADTQVIPPQVLAMPPGMKWTDPATGTIWRRSKDGTLMAPEPKK